MYARKLLAAVAVAVAALGPASLAQADSAFPPGPGSPAAQADSAFPPGPGSPSIIAIL